MNGNEQLGFIAGFPGCGVQQRQRNKDRWQWINSSCNAASAGCSTALIPAPEQAQPQRSPGKPRDLVPAGEQSWAIHANSGVLFPTQLLNKQKTQNKVGFPQNIAALFQPTVEIAWLLFNSETSKRKKKKNWNCCCLDAKEIASLKLLHLPLWFCPVSTNNEDHFACFFGRFHVALAGARLLSCWPYREVLDQFKQ